MTTVRALLPLLGFSLMATASCGARSEVWAPDVGAESAGGSDGAPEERRCLPNCYTGHRCCVGGCGGPAVVTESACCTCLAGEVDSSTCPGATCGGGECTQAGDACETHDECCTGYCDYPSAEAPEKSCLFI